MADEAAEDSTAPNARRFGPAPAAVLRIWDNFCTWPDHEFFPKFMGFQVEEIRQDYARLRLPYHSSLDQPAGVVHGGAIASLVDTCVVPAIGGGYDVRPEMITLSMTINYLGAIVETDAIGEGWVARRGRSIVFCESEVRSATGELAAKASLVYKVRVPTEGSQR